MARKSAFTEEQITFALRQAEAGLPVEDVCRKLGITEQTFYKWKQARNPSDILAPGLQIPTCDWASYPLRADVSPGPIWVTCATRCLPA